VSAEQRPRRASHAIARVSERELVIYRTYGLIDGDVNSPGVALRARRIRRLHRDLGLDYDVIAVVLPLVERIEQLERRSTSPAR
jgi:hypothetical protein